MEDSCHILDPDIPTVHAVHIVFGILGQIFFFFCQLFYIALCFQESGKKMQHSAVCFQRCGKIPYGEKLLSRKIFFLINGHILKSFIHH